MSVLRADSLGRDGFIPQTSATITTVAKRGWATSRLKYNLIIGCKSKNRPQFNFWETCCSCLSLLLISLIKQSGLKSRLNALLQTDTITPSVTYRKVDLWKLCGLESSLSFSKLYALYIVCLI